MSRSTQHYKITLADDDEDDRSFFRDAINQLAVASVLHIYNDGEILLNNLFEEEEIPDIIFLDLHMPKKNGLECMHEIRKQQRFNKVPIVMFTIAGQSPYRTNTDQTVADKYIEKTGSFATLVQTLGQILSEDGYNALLHKPQDQAG